MNNDLRNLLSFYLKQVGISINNDELKLQIISHPSYPSLHAVTGVLDHFRIENLAVEVPKDKETLSQLPEVFFTLIESNNVKDYVVATKSNKASITVHYGNKNKTNTSIDDFINEWTGIVVVAEKNEVTIESQDNNRKGLVNTIYIVCVGLLLATFFFAKPSLFGIVHFVLSLIGIVISILIVKHELGYQSKSVEKLCSASKATSCNAVFNSKGATIFKNFKLSDICLVYFIALVVSWLIMVNMSVGFLSLVLLALLSLPVTLYSIYYQSVVVKKWCPLCLAIVAVLWLQCLSILAFTINVELASISIPEIFVLIISFLICLALWVFIKPLVEKEQKLEKLQIEHYRFKRNFNLFNAVFQMQDVVDTVIPDIDEIVLGEKEAPINITLVTSPLCYYCKATHSVVERLLEQYSNTVSITLRFNINIEDKNAIVYKIVNTFHELYKADINDFMKAIHEAYSENADLEKWLIKWDRSSGIDYETTLGRQKEWCHENGINFTPAVYVNGKAFPKEYDKDDLSYFIEDLV